MAELPKGMTQKKFNDLPTTRAINEGVKSKIEYKVGQSVSVYAPKKGRRGVDDNDLWYGIIECFRVDNRPKASQPFWVKIRWYWSKDLEEDSFKSASQSDSTFFSMGTHELLQSDLTQWSEASVLAVFKFDESSASQKPWNWDGLYTRWYASSLPPKLQALSPAESIKSRLPSTEVHTGFKDELFKTLLCCPVERGIKAGVCGNGWAMNQVRTWYNHLVIRGYPLPHDWIMHLDQVDTKWIIPTKQIASTIYYQCPICPTYWL
ncbi:hypothetical protein F4604DRAFT_1688584 [Suillus subluteus]|nr:hypothetical protein F4604DRAFT_1688584 [Suillus subluteus]